MDTGLSGGSPACAKRQMNILTAAAAMTAVIPVGVGPGEAQGCIKRAIIGGAPVITLPITTAS
jgi:hypothetical protein